LIALCLAKDAKSFFIRAARMYGYGVAFSYTLAMLLAGGADRASTVQGLLFNALTSLSWVVGALSAFAAAQNFAAIDEREGIVALSRQRGYTASALRTARYVATARRTTKFIAVPGLILVLTMLSRVNTFALVDWGLFFAIAVLSYACVLGATLGILAHAASELMPNHPRWLLVAVIFVPMLAKQVWPATPTIPGAFAWMLQQMAELGSRFI
jgi:hypothetical protein